MDVKRAVRICHDRPTGKGFEMILINKFKEVATNSLATMKKLTMLPTKIKAITMTITMIET